MSAPQDRPVFDVAAAFKACSPEIRAQLAQVGLLLGLATIGMSATSDGDDPSGPGYERLNARAIGALVSIMLDQVLDADAAAAYARNGADALPLAPTPALLRSCRVCGCSEHDACQVQSGLLLPSGAPRMLTCHWVEATLCSACAGPHSALLDLPLQAGQR